MTDALPKVSVITPSYNQAAYLPATIRSVLNQGYPNLEYFIMDGGSTDGSADIIRQHAAQLAGWVSEKDNGQSNAFNKGLCRATGEIIGWINSDDLYLGHCVKEAVAFFQKYPAVDIVFSDYIYIDEQGRTLKRRREPCLHRDVYLWTADCYHANCAGFFRRRVFDQLGGLDETLHYGMDYEFYLRAAQAGFQFGHVHHFWGAYRLHASSKSITASDRQRADADTILARYRPPVSPLGRQMRKGCFVARRMIAKSFLMLDRRGAPPPP